MRKNDDWKSILIKKEINYIRNPKKKKYKSARIVKKPLSVDELLDKYKGSTLIKDWDELNGYCKNNPSKTHNFEYDDCCGWLEIINNKEDEWGIYMSTHTFYGATYQNSTEDLQKCGFNVVIDNWDK